MELNCLSSEGGRLWTRNLDFEPLEIDFALALKMFEENRHKTKLLNRLSESSSKGTVSVYRMGDYVDFCKGPLISNTSQLHRFAITAVSICKLPSLINYTVL
jgi:threonyl-tRNA synthetase